jgi:RNA polymerase sigma factor (sigma-70 family)
MIENSEQTRWIAEEVQPHEDKLRNWLRLKFPSLSDVDDLIQESYARLLRAREMGKIRCVRSYFYTTARNVALDFFRHERIIVVTRIAEIEQLDVLDNSPDAAEAASNDDELAVLSEAIRMLPARCREVLVLRKINGLSQKEIARRLHITENTVAAQVSIGMRRCTAYFRDHNIRK